MPSWNIRAALMVDFPAEMSEPEGSECCLGQPKRWDIFIYIFWGVIEMVTSGHGKTDWP